jgi:hypothetical protein
MNEQNKKLLVSSFMVIFFIIVLTDLVQKNSTKHNFDVTNGTYHGPIELPLIKDSKCW